MTPVRGNTEPFNRKCQTFCAFHRRLWTSFLVVGAILNCDGRFLVANDDALIVITGVRINLE